MLGYAAVTTSTDSVSTPCLVNQYIVPMLMFPATLGAAIRLPARSWGDLIPASGRTISSVLPSPLLLVDPPEAATRSIPPSAEMRSTGPVTCPRSYCLPNNDGT